MPFVIVRNDITKMAVDAIVNTANPQPIIGAGTDGMVHQKAGPRLLKARQKIGSIGQGEAAITRGFGLPAKYVIHTVGPVWTDGGQGEEKLLRSCYDASLELAQKYKCQSIAFPLISSGNYGFPKDKALQIAISAFRAFLLENDMQIYLVVFDREAYQLSEKLFQSVSSYIDENYVESCMFLGNKGAARRVMPPVKREIREPEDRTPCKEMEMAAPQAAAMAAPKARSLEDMLKQEDAGFTETLLKLIDKTGKKDSDIYKKANISKQHFSKIRNNLNYKPSKPTAIALALALELDLQSTRDLIGRAGYALTNSSKFDLIIRFFIENRNYNIIEINCVLFEHDQSLLGA